MPPLIDAVAKEIAIRKWGVPECLHVPIAAVDENAVENYVGEIVQKLGSRSPSGALVVRAYDPPPIDTRFPIWKLEQSAIFHQPMQLWAHVGYTSYRKAYRSAFPAEDIREKIMSHCMNRRVAALKGFQYVRITPTSRGANSSSAFSEGRAVTLHSSPKQMEANRKRGVFIQYADLSDLMLMLDLKLGGGIMDAVNEGQKLIRPDSEDVSSR
jgi:hypothetical protein